MMSSASLIRHVTRRAVLLLTSMMVSSSSLYPDSPRSNVRLHKDSHSVGDWDAGGYRGFI